METWEWVQLNCHNVLANKDLLKMKLLDNNLCGGVKRCQGSAVRTPVLLFLFLEKNRRTTKVSQQEEKYQLRRSCERKKKNRQADQEWSNQRRRWFGTMSLIKWSTPSYEEYGEKKLQRVAPSSVIQLQLVYIMNV